MGLSYYSLGVALVLLRFRKFTLKYHGYPYISVESKSISGDFLGYELFPTLQPKFRKPLVALSYFHGNASDELHYLILPVITLTAKIYVANHV